MGSSRLLTLGTYTVDLVVPTERGRRFPGHAVVTKASYFKRIKKDASASGTTGYPGKRCRVSVVPTKSVVSATTGPAVKS